MEDSAEPDYGHVSPAEAEAMASASAGDPDQDGAQAGRDGRDDINPAGHGSGSQVRTPEDLAREMLESCEGLEPAYEYMSVEGSPDRLDLQDLRDGGAEQGQRSQLDCGKEQVEQAPPILMNGVGPTGSSGARGDHGCGGAEMPSQGITQGNSAEVDLESLVRKLVFQNQMLHEELSAVKQGSRGASSTASEGREMYRAEPSERRVSQGSEVASVGDGRGMKSVGGFRASIGDRGKGRGSHMPHVGEPAGETGGWQGIRLFNPPWTQFSGAGESLSPQAQAPLGSFAEAQVHQRSQAQAPLGSFAEAQVHQRSQAQAPLGSFAEAQVHQRFQAQAPLGSFAEAQVHQRSQAQAPLGSFAEAQVHQRFQAQALLGSVAEAQVHQRSQAQAPLGSFAEAQVHQRSQAQALLGSVAEAQVHQRSQVQVPSGPLAEAQAQGTHGVLAKGGSQMDAQAFAQTLQGTQASRGLLGKLAESCSPAATSQPIGQSMKSGGHPSREHQAKVGLGEADLWSSPNESHGVKGQDELRGSTASSQVGARGTSTVEWPSGETRIKVDEDVRVKKLVVIVDGVPREGVIDMEGNVQVKHAGPEYFSIASEEPEGQVQGGGERTIRPTPPLPVFGNSSGTSSSPFDPHARSPFQRPSGSGEATPVAPPPQDWIPPRPTGSPPKTRSQSPVTPRRRPGYGKQGFSPATPGGTRLPPGSPPSTPPSVGVTDSAEMQGDIREFMPGDRTVWELPRLGPTSEHHPALRCSDWIHKIQPLLHDLSPKAYIWWGKVMEEAREAYRKWLGATPLERLGIQGIPSSYLQGERFLRLESRALAMLSKAVPQAIYDNALSIRNTTCVGLIFLVLKAFQPGGLHERTELLRGLTSLGETPTALQGVTALQYWFRHLERARSMGVAVPDCTLLLDALDGMVKPMLEKNPALLFRLNTTRMALQLDTVPTLPSVEQFARALLAELEVLAVSAPEGTAKKQRVAALAGTDTGSGKGGAKPSAAAQSQDQGKKGLGKSKTPCTGWVTDAGCRFGKNCSFSHEAPRPQKCWVCGGAHQKADCTMPGGGKGPVPEAKQKVKVQPAAPSAKDKGKPHQKPSEVKPETGGKGSQETTAAIKEATKLLQSMRLAKVGVHLEAAMQINDLSHRGRCCGLIDGGATACLRTAKSHELQLPTLDVELAFGKCKLHVNQAGTLLSPTPVNPIVSVAALLELGFEVDWSRESCAITHPARSALWVDASSGCPEVPVSTALQLITEYEELVKKRDVREARIRCILKDMQDDTQAQLAGALVTGGVEAEAALRLLLGRLFSDVASTVWDEVIPVITEEHCNRGWNRRIRRRVERSNGVLVHMGEKGSKRQLQNAADRCGQVLLHVDVYSRGLSVATFAYLLELAQRGLIKGVVGSLPYRSFSVYNYVADCTSEEQSKGSVRLSGVSIGTRDGMLLPGPEAAARHHDDIMFLRMLTLQAVALEVARFRRDEPPAVIIEQPEQQDEGPSFWTTPEWCSFRDRYKMAELGFDQGPLLHKKRRPTTIGTNLTPAAALVDCRGPGLDAIGDPMLSRQGEEAWSSWAPGLIAAVTDMLVHRNKAGSCGYPAVAVRAMDAAFVQHLKQGHVPFRRDCRFCVRGGGKRRQHKRVLCPEGWSRSVDTAGPYKRAPDESGKKARYMITGVLTVPVLELKEGEDEEGELVEPEVECHAGGALSDEEIFAEGEDEKDPELSAKDVGEAKANRGLWEDLVKRDQEAWKAEAEQEYLPKIKMVEWVFVESVSGKGQQQVLNAISRMRTQALHLGFDVRRLHTDRGREYNNAGLKAWCAEHSIIKTLAFAEEHQGNGRVEATIGRIKSLTRTFLEQGEALPEEWPLAISLAALTLQNKARAQLHMARKPMVPYNTQVQVVQRTWRRGAWHAVTVGAKTKGPSADNERGWIVVTSDGNFLTTSKMFPGQDADKKVVIRYEGDPINPEAPARRIRQKAAARRLAPSIPIADPKNELDSLAATLLKSQDFSPTGVARLAMEISRTPGAMQGGNPTPAVIKGRGTVFFSGAFAFSGMSGVKNQCRGFPWVTAYLAHYLREFTAGPFAAVGLVWNAEHSPHKDVHNQRGIDNIVIPVVTDGGGLWVQEEGLQSS